MASEVSECQGLVLSVYTILEEAVVTFRRLVEDVAFVLVTFLFFRRNWKRTSLLDNQRSLA